MYLESTTQILPKFSWVNLQKNVYYISACKPSAIPEISECMTE